MKSCWSCNMDGENLGCSWADYDPSHLQKCWLRTPDSITSDRIWSRYQNEGLLDQRNSPPGSHDPRCQSSKKRQIDDKNWLQELLQAEYTTPLQADLNAAASRLQHRGKQIKRTITSWFKPPHADYKNYCKLITKTITIRYKRRLQADRKDDYKLIKETITSWSKGQLQTDVKAVESRYGSNS